MGGGGGAVSDAAFDTQDLLYGNVAVKYYSVQPGRPDTILDITNAAIYPVLVKSPKPSGGALKDNDIKVSLSFASLGSVRPKLRDRIYPAESVPYFGGRSYTVLDGSPGLISEHYQISARDLVIENSLAELISIWRPRRMKDAAGRISREHYLPLKVGIPGKAQPGDASVNEELGVKAVRSPWVVYLEFDPGTEIDDQVRLPDGRILEVVGRNDPAAIDALPSLLCEDQGARWRDG